MKSQAIAYAYSLFTAAIAGALAGVATHAVKTDTEFVLFVIANFILWAIYGIQLAEFLRGCKTWSKNEIV